MTFVTWMFYSVRDINRQGEDVKQTAWNKQGTDPAARTSVWVLCEECGHTSRVLSVMASRVLKERKHCPQCQSAAAPSLHYTAAGAYIHPSDALHTSGATSQPSDLQTSLDWNQPRGVRSLFAHPFAWLRGTLS